MEKVTISFWTNSKNVQTLENFPGYPNARRSEKPTNVFREELLVRKEELRELRTVNNRSSCQALTFFRRPH